MPQATTVAPETPWGASGGREAPGSANTQERQGLARLDCVALFQKGASIAGQVELEGKD